MSRCLIDTSVWIDHLRKPSSELVSLLSDRAVLIHDLVIGELACGHLPKREQFLADLQLLPRAQQVDTADVLHLIEKQRLFGKGLGWVDMHLIASALVSEATLLTYDKRLKEVFARMTR